MKTWLLFSPQQPFLLLFQQYLRYMLSIHLHNVSFRAFHGLYEEEKINGNDFIVDVTVQYRPPKTIHHLNETINYVQVYEIVKDRMNVATELLETVAMDIAATVLNTFSLAEEVKVSIKKLNPPITHFNGTVGVSFEMKR
jgi:dihydroneopterin aldolase